MTRNRRSVLHAGTAIALGGLAGCSSLQEQPQLLVLENQTDTDHEVEIVVNDPPPAGGTEASDATATTTVDDATTTATVDDATATTTNDRYVVDFTFDVAANSGKELNGLFPTDGTYEVVAAVTDVGQGSTQYTDKENTRVRITDTGVQVSTFTGSP